MRYSEPLLMMFLVFTTLAHAGQQSNSATSTEKDFLPAGPFLFEPGAIHPTHMDAFDDRPAVKSPSGKTQITITGPRESIKAWVTLQFLGPYTQDLGYQVWPIQRDVAVLWRPDSEVFALTDNRYANLSYVLVFGTDFRMGENENEPGLGVPITDLTPIVRKAFGEKARKYYETDKYDTLLFYAKVLRWIGTELLVGVSARTLGPVTFPDRGQNEWDFAYVIDVPNMRVVREVTKDQLLSEYKIKVPD